MKHLFLIIKIIILSSIAYGQNSIVDNSKFPIMTFESEIIDYGTIEQGSNGEREFKFTNTGNAPLIISKAQNTCGCTIPSWPKEPINPGESSVIKVKYDTKRLGIINKSVTIISNAKRATIPLRIKGKIVATSSSIEKEKAIPREN